MSRQIVSQTSLYNGAFDGWRLARSYSSYSETETTPSKQGPECKQIKEMLYTLPETSVAPESMEDVIM